ncbi:tax1-binding protein 1 homolog isoform X2 [Xenopus tropicalis]|uniref:Tax1-binding protein 1 homolog n=1 Tax=Xenopus tropicalis TaxID=8364 RepID=A0A803JSW1_XENTR|nr:tax1-binding protein 1 homolog isoform X2 [Xenopus tropicalis]
MLLPVKMSALQEIPSPISNMQTSNFAHVIFQNVAKSYLPNAPLECHYTLTQYIHPHPKDWVGIFKVGWSTPRDYFTFLWSLMPEKYVAESTCNCVLTFQGYYLPNDDGEFYQFCYVTHKGEIRGASTPFQFRASSPVDELLTMEDEGHSDMLVVTTKTGLLELKIEKTMKEKEELVKITTVLEKEVLQLREHVEGLESEFLREQKRSEQLSSEREELFNASEILRNESDEAKRKCKEMSAKIIQLEEDIMLVTQKAIAKETELDSLKDKLKKVVLEKDQLECQLKYEKDEKDLYKVHLKNTEIENTKLLTEVQTLKNLDTNKENLISHYKEELGKLQICLADKEKMNKELLQNSSNKEDIAFLKQQLRKLEDQHQASRQEVSLMSRELSEAVNKRDKTMADLHSARLDTDSVRMQLADALAQLSMRDEQQQKSNPFAKKDQGADNNRVEQELRKEVEDLKLRLQMAADHYKDKFKECQKLQKQVVKLTEQLKATENQQKERELFCATEAAAVTVMKQCTPPVSPFTSDSLPEFDIREQVREMSLEMAEKTEKYRKCKQMLAEEKARCSAYADDVAKMELKWKEQLKVNDSIKRQLIALDDQYKVQSAEKDREICDLSYSIETLRNEKAKMERFINDLEKKLEKQAGWAASNTQGLQFFNPYCDEHRLAPAIPAQQPLLQFGNPYASQETRDGADGAFNPDEVQGPPVRATSWGLEDKVVCSQPARNLSRPDGLEDPDENNAGLITKDEDDDDDDDNVNFEQTPDPTRIAMHDQSGFCFEAGYTMNKKCPLCPVSFPPNYDQGQFEAHVESHWKVCPMCNEQFPPDCDQQIFERHVQTHFDGSVLNFD